jgi:sugar (pentulose or hexulose) kinase
MKQNFFAVDLGATSGRTILGSFIEGGLNLEEINRFPNHLIEVGGHFYWDIYALYRHIIDGLKLVAKNRKFCICTAMLYDPTDPRNIKKEQERNNI